MFYRHSFVAVVLLGLSLVSAALVWACIPDFPISLLRGDDDGVVCAPNGNFEHEVRRAA